MAWLPVIASAAVGLWGANKQASAATKQANLQNEATERQFEYDNELYDMTAEQIKAKRAFAVQETELKRKNDRNVADYRDAINASNYNQQLLIRNREQQSLDNQFRKSEEVYSAQMGYNARSAANAKANEFRKLDEIYAEGAFNAQEQRLESLQAEGKTRALGQSGRSAGKTQQAISANFGQRISALNAGLVSAGKNMESVIKEIQNDKFSADLAAYANKMQDPGELPMPIQPIPSIVTEYLDPMELEDFHFGPRPVKGARVSASAAASAAWGSAIPSIVNTGMNTYKLFKG